MEGDKVLRQQSAGVVEWALEEIIMGILDICKGKELLKYGSGQKSTGCECVTKNNPHNIYTDGSLFKESGQGGYGVYSKGLDISISKSYPLEEHNNNILRLESKAILEAVTHVKKNHKTLHRVDIFSDSEHALTHLQVLQNGEKPLPGDDNNGLGERILKEINEKEWKAKVHMHKVKAHSGIEGNDMADSFARSGALQSRRVDRALLPKSPLPKKDDEIYSTFSSFSSCNRKRDRISQSPSTARSPFPCRGSNSNNGPHPPRSPLPCLGSNLPPRSPLPCLGSNLPPRSPLPCLSSNLPPRSPLPCHGSNSNNLPPPPSRNLFGGFIKKWT